MVEKEKDVDVLVVEDSLDDSELTQYAMIQNNDRLHLRHFNDGVEALNFIFARRRFEGNKIQKGLKLVILDLRLPTIDGLDILKIIREDSATKMLPVVILTSSTDREDVAAAYKLGANSYVIKPNGFDNYVKKIESLSFYWNNVNERPY
jgi:DNA-binding response OmpR family regulator